MTFISRLTFDWTVIASLFTILTLFRLRGRMGVSQRVEFPPAILLLRPVDSPTASELDLLRRPVTYRGDLKQVVITPFSLSLPRDIEWLPSQPDCPNRKVGHLLFGLEQIERAGRIVVSIDADVSVTDELLESLAVPVSQGAALVSAAPRPVHSRGLPGRAARAWLRNTHHNFVALFWMRRTVPTICGKAIGLGTAAQAELAHLTHVAGEDLELGARLEAKSHPVLLATCYAKMPQADNLSWKQALERPTRWMCILRKQRPWLYLTVPLLLAPTSILAVLTLVSPSLWTLGAILTLGLVRSFLAFRLGEEWTVGWVGGEILLLVAFTRSLFMQQLYWRGRRFSFESARETSA